MTKDGYDLDWLKRYVNNLSIEQISQQPRKWCHRKYVALRSYVTANYFKDDAFHNNDEVSVNSVLKALKARLETFGFKIDALGVVKVPSVTKQEVIDAFGKMKAAGIKNPYETIGPEAEEAQGLLNDWRDQLKVDANKKGGNAAMFEFFLANNTILIDAGYDDAEMINSALDWLDQDLHNTEEVYPEECAEVAEKIRAKIKELEDMLENISVIQNP